MTDLIAKGLSRVGAIAGPVLSDRPSRC